MLYFPGSAGVRTGYATVVPGCPSILFAFILWPYLIEECGSHVQDFGMEQ
jgi:hypothetical protein